MANKFKTYVNDNLEFYQMLKGIAIVMHDDDNPDDYIKGTNKADTVNGMGGNDYLQTGNGADTAYGGEGNDVINAGKGDDYLDGGHGNDYLISGRGNDEIHAGTGNDIIDARDGSNIIYSGEGADRIVLMYDQATMEGRKGNDTPFLWDGLDDAYSIVKDYTVGEDIIHIQNAGTNTINYDETDTHIDLMDDTGNIIVRIERLPLDPEDEDSPLFGYSDLTIDTGKFKATKEMTNIVSSEPPPLPLAVYDDIIEGEDGNDNLYGTFASEVFQSMAGQNDYITGGGGNDIFVFRDETTNGQRDIDFIRDFSNGDLLDLGNNEITKVYTSSSFTYIHFGDDEDTIMLQGFTSFNENIHVL